VRSFLILLFLSSLLFADEDYELGEGIKVGSLPLYIGGYISLNYLQREQQSEFRVDDIALMGYGNYNKFSYMLELEFKELYVYRDYHGDTSTQTNTSLHLERAYLDYNFDENYIFRAGKYNSPIGFWNLLPINVLRETTSSPKSTYIVFPRFTTGLDTSYTTYSNAEIKINISLQHNEGIDENYNNYNTNRHYGAGLSYEIDEYTFKLNGGYFHIEDETPQNSLYYMLFSAKYESDKYQLLTEFGSQRSRNKFTTKYAGYIQGLYRFTPRHIGVLRAESYEQTQSNISDKIMLIGYTYRPLFPLALKSEYQFHSKDDSNEILFSVSVLF